MPRTRVHRKPPALGLVQQAPRTAPRTAECLPKPGMHAQPVRRERARHPHPCQPAIRRTAQGSAERLRRIGEHRREQCDRCVEILSRRLVECVREALPSREEPLRILTSRRGSEVVDDASERFRKSHRPSVQAPAYESSEAAECEHQLLPTMKSRTFRAGQTVGRSRRSRASERRQRATGTASQPEPRPRQAASGGASPGTPTSGVTNQSSAVQPSRLGSAIQPHRSQYVRWRRPPGCAHRLPGSSRSRCGPDGPGPAPTAHRPPTPDLARSELPRPRHTAAPCSKPLLRSRDQWMSGLSAVASWATPPSLGRSPGRTEMTMGTDRGTGMSLPI